MEKDGLILEGRGVVPLAVNDDGVSSVTRFLQAAVTATCELLALSRPLVRCPTMAFNVKFTQSNKSHCCRDAYSIRLSQTQPSVSLVIVGKACMCSVISQMSVKS